MATMPESGSAGFRGSPAAEVIAVADIDVVTIDRSLLVHLLAIARRGVRDEADRAVFHELQRITRTTGGTTAPKENP